MSTANQIMSEKTNRDTASDVKQANLSRDLAHRAQYPLLNALLIYQLILLPDPAKQVARYQFCLGVPSQFLPLSLSRQ